MTWRGFEAHARISLGLTAVLLLACAGAQSSGQREWVEADGLSSGDEALARNRGDPITATGLQQQMTATTEDGISPAPAPPAAPPAPGEVMVAVAAEPAANTAVAPNPPEKETPATREGHRLALIYDARVHLAVFETDKAIDAAEQLAREADGYLVQRDDHAISFRVPSARFHETLVAALKLGDVLHREVRVRDVTEEFRDLKVRLQNLEAVRERLAKLLDRADDVGKALQVERELERVAGEIERIKGKLAMLQELIAFSTITLQFEPRPIDQVDSQVRLPFPWLEELGLTRLLDL